MQTASNGDNFMKCQILFSGKNKKNIHLSSAEYAQSMVKAKYQWNQEMQICVCKSTNTEV